MPSLTALVVVAIAMAGAPADLAAMDLEPQTEEPSGIINGDKAESDDFPMVGALLIDGELDFGGGGNEIRWFNCSSALIAPDVVLAAAHCVDWDTLTDGQGTLGDAKVRWTKEQDVRDFSGGNVERWPDNSVRVREWVVHPGWDWYGMVGPIGENDDIALLFLEEPVLDVPLAYLPSYDEDDLVRKNAPVYLVGYGRTDATDGNSSGRKRQGLSKIGTVEDWEFHVGETEPEVRQCFGDSGGPTFAALDPWSSLPTASGDRTLRLVGVVSHLWDGTQCEEKGALNTRVDYYLDWLDDEMRQRCDDGSRVWCEIPGIVDPEWPDQGLLLGLSEEELPVACGCVTQASGWPGGAWLLPLLLLARRGR